MFRWQAALGGLVPTRPLGDAIGCREPRYAALHANGLVAQLLVPRNIFECVIDVTAGGVAIDKYAVAALAAKQVIDRSVESFALDVPQGHVDSGDRRHGYRAPAPIGSAIQILPDIFRLKWIASDDTGDN